MISRIIFPPIIMIGMITSSTYSIFPLQSPILVPIYYNIIILIPACRIFQCIINTAIFGCYLTLRIASKVHTVPGNFLSGIHGGIFYDSWVAYILCRIYLWQCYRNIRKADSLWTESCQHCYG